MAVLVYAGPNTSTSFANAIYSVNPAALNLNTSVGNLEIKTSFGNK